MTYIATGQIMAAVAFFVFSVWFWAVLYEKVGGLGGLLVGFLVGVPLALLVAVFTFFAWPVTIVCLLVFAVTRYRAGRRMRFPHGFQP